MNIIAVFGAAFLLNVYLCYLFILDSEVIKGRRKRDQQLQFIRERRQYLKYMVHGFGMKWEDAQEEYKKLESYDALMLANREMKRLIKKHNL